MSQGWYVIVGGKEKGPFSSARIKAFASEGKITPATLLRREDQDDPCHARQIRGLFAPPAGASGDVSGTATRKKARPSTAVRVQKSRWQREFTVAKKRARRGAIAGFVVAGLTLTLVMTAIITKDERLAVANDPWMLVLVTLMAGLSFGIWRYSRVAAVLLFVYYLADRVMTMIEAGSLRGAGIPALLLVFFAYALAGTLAYHRTLREQDPAYRAAKRWMYFTWVPAGSIVAILLALAAFAPPAPPFGVVAGSELSQADLDSLRTEGILQPEEDIVLFYTTAISSILEEGNLITDQRVVSYESMDQEIWMNGALYEEIAKIRVEQVGGILEDTVIMVTRDDGEAFPVVACTQDKGNERFLREMRSRWQDARR